MRGSAGFWALLTALLAAAGAGWLLLRGGEGAVEGDDYALEHVQSSEPTLGPMLSGQGRGPGAAEAAEGEFVVRGTVKDAKGKPAAGVPVAARRRGDLGPDGRRYVWDAGVELRRAFDEMRSPGAPAKPAVTAVSDAEGAFALTLRRRGLYDVRAEPEPPRAGTSVRVHVADGARAPVELRVLSGAALRGRVVDARGAGVLARVTASWNDDVLAWSSDPTASQAGSGTFAFPVVPDGKVQLGLQLAGRVQYTAATVTTPTTDEVVLRVGDDLPLLTGRVKDREGRPVPGALVAVSLQRGLPADPALPRAEPVYVRYFAEADAQGEFAVQGAWVGAVSNVQAAATGYLTYSSEPPLAPWSGLALAATGPATIELTLLRGGTLEGRVTEKETGRPLAGVRLALQPWAMDARVGSAQGTPGGETDAQGRYRIEGVPLGRSLISVQHETHFLPSRAAAQVDGPMTYWSSDGNVVYGPGMGGASGQPSVFIQTEGQRVTKDLELTPGATVQGRVLGADGKPVAGASVTRLGSNDGMMEYSGSGTTSPGSATSDDQGRFTLRGLAPNPATRLVARKHPLVGEPCEPFAVALEAPAKEVLLKLVAGATLAGQVLDERGSPVAGAQVQAWPNNWDGTYQPQPVRSGEDGSFQLEGLGAGTWNVNAWLTGGSNAQAAVADLAAGERRDGVVLKLAQGLALAGVLVDDQGLAVPGKELVAQSPQGANGHAYSGSDGVFRFEGLPAGTAQVFGGGWGPGRVSLGSFDVPCKDVRIVWKEPPFAVIEGTILDAQGLPVPLARVSMRAGPAAPPPAPGMAVPAMMGPMEWSGGGGGGPMAVNGWFRQRIGGEPPYQVSVSAAQDVEGRPLNLRGTSVTVTDPKAGPLTIRLEPGLEIAGQVLDAAGRGLADVSVRVGSLGTTTDAQGGFVVGGLTEGKHSVQVMPPAPWVRPLGQQFAAGTRDVLVRLVAGMAITGVVRRPDGKAVGSGWIQASWPAGPGVAAGNGGANPDAQGRFKVDALPPEVRVTLTVQAWDQEGGTTLAPRTVKDVLPGTEGLEIVLGAGVSVKGTVVDAQGRPVAAGGYVRVSVGPEGRAQTHHVAVGEGGVFELGGLEPGPAQLTYHPPDGGSPTETLKSDAPAQGLRLVVPERTPIKGRVTGMGGQLGKLRVSAWTTGEGARRVRGTLDGEGRFSLDGVSGKGPWTVGVQGDDDDRYALATGVSGGTENLALDLREGRPIEGTVQVGGAAAPGSRVMLTGADGWSARATADAQGAFRLRGLPPGRYTLSARSTDGRPGEALRDVQDGAAGVRLQLP